MKSKIVAVSVMILSGCATHKTHKTIDTPKASSHAQASDAASAEDSASGDTLTLRITQVLSMYSLMAGKELVVDSAVTNQLAHAAIRVKPAPSREEQARSIERELRQQVAVVITPIDDKRASVKFAKEHTHE